MHAKLRQEVERRIGGSLDDRLWAFLQENGYIEDYEIDNNLDQLVVIIREMTTIVRMAPTRDKRTEGSPDDRWLKLSDVVAKLASEDDDVKNFRDRAVGTELVSWGDLRGWIEGLQASESGPSGHLTFPEPPGTRFERSTDGVYRAIPPIETLGRSLGRSRPTLLYACPGDAWVRVALHVVGGKLDWLRQLSEDLAAYGWSKAQGAIFAVCGVTPLLEPVRIRHSGGVIRRGVSHSWAERIVMEVDPTVSPKEVARAYQEARRHADHANHRALGPKHLALAAFKWGEGAHLSPGEAFLAWNEANPQWRYGQASNFRRDLARAEIRLLHPDTLVGQTRIN